MLPREHFLAIFADRPIFRQLCGDDEWGNEVLQRPTP